MTTVNPPAIEFHGTVTECTTGPTPTCEKVVYQRTIPGAGNIPGDQTHTRQRRRWVKPYDPKTPAQLSRRHRFQLAIIGYRENPASHDTAARAIQQARNLPYYQAWLSAYLRDNAAPTGAPWDGATTEWDTGTTIWDTVTPIDWDTGATLWDGGTTLWDHP